MALTDRFKKFVFEFKSASVLDKVIFILALAAAAGLLYEHGLVHTGIIKSFAKQEKEHSHAEFTEFSTRKAQGCADVSDAKTYTVEIKNSTFVPAKVEAKVCDHLQFINLDEILHEPAFGAHPTHLDYPGYEEKGLLQNNSNEFVLGIAGTFSFHDHLDDEIEGLLIVNP